MKYPSFTLLWILSLSIPALSQDTLLLSSHQGDLGNGRSINPEASVDGRFVVWQTESTNLVPGDTTGDYDVVLLDRNTGNMELVSRTPAGLAGEDQSIYPTISASGRFVAFATRADDILTTGPGVAIYDRITGSIQSATPPASTLSAHDPRISPEGRYVVYSTSLPFVGADTNNTSDIYRFDRVTSQLELVSATASGLQSDAWCVSADVSMNGRYVSFEAHTMGGEWGAQYVHHRHIWRKDMLTGELVAVSVDGNGTPGDNTSSFARISGDGARLVFETQADNILPPSNVRQIAVKNFETGDLSMVSVGVNGLPASGHCILPAISSDGRHVSFGTASINLPGGGSPTNPGVWVRDLLLGVTTKISLSSAATGHMTSLGQTHAGPVSVTGQFAIFYSNGNNLVAGDTNNNYDIFLREITGSQPTTYGWSPTQSLGCMPHIEFSGTPSASTGSGFEVSLEDVTAAQPGILIYSKSGPAATPLFGSFLHLAPPIVRTPVRYSGGTPGTCEGSFTMDFNDWVVTGPDGALVAGSSVWAQYWSRDPGDLDGAHLSDAVTFILAP